LRGSLRMSFVGYRDFNHPVEERYVVKPFTSNVDAFKSSLVDVEARSAPNPDYPEDIHGGLERVLSLDWRADRARILLLLADDPCHGRQHHPFDVFDYFGEIDPADALSERLLSGLVQRRVRLHFIRIRGSTDLMHANWERIYNKAGEEAGLSMSSSSLENMGTAALVGHITRSTVSTVIGPGVNRSHRVRHL